MTRASIAPSITNNNGGRHEDRGKGEYTHASSQQTPQCVQCALAGGLGGVQQRTSDERRALCDSSTPRPAHSPSLLRALCAHRVCRSGTQCLMQSPSTSPRVASFHHRGRTSLVRHRCTEGPRCIPRISLARHGQTEHRHSAAILAHAVAHRPQRVRARLSRGKVTGHARATTQLDARCS